MTPSPITALAKDVLVRLLTKGVLIVSTALLAHHFSSTAVKSVQDAIDIPSVAEGIIGAAAVGFSLLQAKWHNTKLVVAATTGQTSAKASQSDTVMLLRAGLMPPKPISAAQEAAATAPLAVPPVPPAK